ADGRDGRGGGRAGERREVDGRHRVEIESRRSARTRLELARVDADEARGRETHGGEIEAVAARAVGDLEGVDGHTDELLNRNGAGNEGTRRPRLVRVREDGIHAGAARMVGRVVERTWEGLPRDAVVADRHRAWLREGRTRDQADGQEGI